MSAANSKLGAGRPSAKSQKTLSDLADKAATVRVNFDLDRDATYEIEGVCREAGKDRQGSSDGACRSFLKERLLK
jgi:hypothetical protein